MITRAFAIIPFMIALISWDDGYQKHKDQKAKIKEELLSVARHLDLVMDWCMPEDEKMHWK